MRPVTSMVSIIVSLSLLGCVTATNTRSLVAPWETGRGKSVRVTMLDSTHFYGTLLGVDSSRTILLSQQNAPALVVRADSVAHVEYFTDDLVATAIGYAVVFIGLNVLIWAASPSRW